MECLPAVRQHCEHPLVTFMADLLIPRTHTPRKEEPPLCPRSQTIGNHEHRSADRRIWTVAVRPHAARNDLRGSRAGYRVAMHGVERHRFLEHLGAPADTGRRGTGSSPGLSRRPPSGADGPSLAGNDGWRSGVPAQVHVASAEIDFGIVVLRIGGQRALEERHGGRLVPHTVFCLRGLVALLDNPPIAKRGCELRSGLRAARQDHRQVRSQARVAAWSTSRYDHAYSHSATVPPSGAVISARSIFWAPRRS
ncbi:MAG: hypothetical protein H6Q86_1714 [candidate division NC10 bacterium]|nr:hypothetical protein [candidate division NC10 bacterium]